MFEAISNYFQSDTVDMILQVVWFVGAAALFLLAVACFSRRA